MNLGSETVDYVYKHFASQMTSSLFEDMIDDAYESKKDIIYNNVTGEWYTVDCPCKQ